MSPAVGFDNDLSNVGQLEALEPSGAALRGSSLAAGGWLILSDVCVTPCLGTVADVCPPLGLTSRVLNCFVTGDLITFGPAESMTPSPALRGGINVFCVDRKSPSLGADSLIFLGGGSKKGILSNRLNPVFSADMKYDLGFVTAFAALWTFLVSAIGLVAMRFKVGPTW